MRNMLCSSFTSYPPPGVTPLARIMTSPGVCDAAYSASPANSQPSSLAASGASLTCDADESDSFFGMEDDGDEQPHKIKRHKDALAICRIARSFVRLKTNQAYEGW